MSTLDSGGRVPYRFPIVLYAITLIAICSFLLATEWSRKMLDFGNAITSVETGMRFLIRQLDTSARAMGEQTAANGLPKQITLPGLENLFVIERASTGAKVIAAYPAKAQINPALLKSTLIAASLMDDQPGTLRLYGESLTPNSVVYLYPAGRQRLALMIFNNQPVMQDLKKIDVDQIRVIARLTNPNAELQFLSYQRDIGWQSTLSMPMERTLDLDIDGTQYRIMVTRAISLADAPWILMLTCALLFIPIFWFVGRGIRRQSQTVNKDLIVQQEKTAETVRTVENEKRTLLAQADRLRIFPLAISQLNEGIAIIDKAHRIRFCNNAFMKMLVPDAQRSRGAENLNIAAFLPPVILKAVADCEPFRAQLAMRDINGLEMFVDIQIAPVNDDPRPGHGDAKTVRHFAITIDDITDRKRAVAEAEMERSSLRATLRAIGDGVIVVDANCNVCNINMAAENLLRIENIAAQGRSIDELLRFVDDATHEGHINPVVVAVNNKRANRIPINVDCITEKGYRFPIDGTVTVQIGTDDRLHRAIMVFRDVTVERREIRLMERKAYYDTLTKIPNREYFTKELNHLFDMGDGSDNTHCLAFIDLDGFKQVNDKGGHAVGDRILIKCSELMSQHIRRGDMVSRQGGDEFLILFKHCDLEKAKDVCEKMRRAINEHVEVEAGMNYSVGGSIGVVEFQMNEGVTTETVRHRSDVLMYEVKRTGKNRVNGRRFHEINDDGMVDPKTKPPTIDQPNPIETVLLPPNNVTDLPAKVTSITSKKTAN